MTRPAFLGIDLGTTNSGAAVFDGEQVQLVRSQDGPITPSVVRIDARGHVTVGQKARRMLDTDPDNTRGEFKRLMGSSHQLEFKAAKTTRSPVELSAEVLRTLRGDASEQLGFEPRCAVVGVPALFELPQSSATAESARLAGFERVELIQEPVASALAAGWKAEEGAKPWLVYDLGGGTFDASLLEMREGLLRVVGHDGDNFLGGRDFDWALVDELLAGLSRLRQRPLARGDADPADLRRLKLAVEEARIELSRGQQATVTWLGSLTLAGKPLDEELTITREMLERVGGPLVDRSLQVCLRLLTAHGLQPSDLSRILLVGGPTLMPFLRARIRESLGVPFAEQLDPMTLVAQGAALFAAVAGLDSRPVALPVSRGVRVWLHHPAMTSDLMPHVLGRFTDERARAQITSVTILRADGGWQSDPLPLDVEGAFLTTVSLLPRRANAFRVSASAAGGQQVALAPDRFEIVHGLSLSDPPVSRSLGVAQADDRVRVYFERGAPLPARRTFRHTVVETIAKGADGHALSIPIVQGEFEKAHLCRLVGSLRIPGSELTSSLAAGSDLEVTLEMDRGGRLRARALVPATGQVFEEVAQLVGMDASPEALEASRSSIRDRLSKLRSHAFRESSAKTVEALSEVEQALATVDADIAAVRAGEADAGLRAARALLEIDATLEASESDRRWPEVDAEIQHEASIAASWVATLGTESERTMLEQACRTLWAAKERRQLADVERQLRVVRRLGVGAYLRHPQAWNWELDEAASRLDEALDLPRAERLVREGNEARGRQDTETVRQVVLALRQLLPGTSEERSLSYGSGVR